MQAIINLLLSGLAVVISAYIIPGVTLDGFFTAIVVAIVLGLVNMFIKPLIVLLTLPINVLTLGLFSFVIQAFMVILVTKIVPGFAVSSFWIAMLFAIVLSLVTTLLYRISQ
jgi:putative membrane protein